MNGKDNTNTAASAKAERNYGIDALRMLAMLLVVIAHILGPGGILETVEFMSLQYKAAWLMEIIAYCSVNCYALISGYVGIHSRHRYHSIILLWLRVIFYTVGITAVFAAFVPGSVTMRDWIKAFLPTLSGYYWYFTAYFALFVFLPLLNPAINKLTQQQLKAIIISLIITFSILQTLSGKDIFGVSSNAWWLMILYIIGGYIGKYGLLKKCSSAVLFLGYVSMIVSMWLSKLIMEAGLFPPLSSLGGNNLIYHTSPAMLAAGIFLLLLFERLRTSQGINKVIRLFAPAAFSVYIIHGQPFIWNYLLELRFSGYAAFSVPVLTTLVLLTAAAVYVVCSLIDMIRENIFKALKIKQRLARVEEKYIGNLWD